MVYFPLPDLTGHVLGPEGEVKEDVRGTEHVFFIDDEKAIVAGATMMFEGMGYTVDNLPRHSLT